MTLGIIDVGTNSIHLLVGILGLNGKFHVLIKERDLTRLGDGGLAKGALTAASMRRAGRVLRGYAKTLKRARVDHIEAVATSAVREASNGEAFVRRVRRVTGLPLRIISGRVEARLIYLGVLQSHGIRRPTMIVAIGGGSMQIITGTGLRIDYATSLPLGCARLKEQFIRHDPATPEELEALTRHVKWSLAPAARAMSKHHWSQVLGSSATIAQLVMAAHLRRNGHRPKRKHQQPVTRAALKDLVEWLAESTTEQRVQLLGLDPRRQDLALTTGVALLTWMELCDIDRLSYAAGSLREGLVLDYLIRHHQRRIPRMEDPLGLLFNPGQTVGQRG